MVTLAVCGFPFNQYQILNGSVGDPDPHVFGPPGSGSIVRGTDPDPVPDPSLFS
jgi:hypothetical protein